jgi:hypothetical protein
MGENFWESNKVEASISIKSKQLLILEEKIFSDQKIHAKSEMEKKHKIYFLDFFL